MESCKKVKAEVKVKVKVKVSLNLSLKYYEILNINSFGKNTLFCIFAGHLKVRVNF
jgi:Fe-S cluster assembly ATPase SufC